MKQHLAGISSHYRSDMGVEVLFVPWQLPCYLKVPRGRATPIGTPAFVWPNLSPKLKEVLYQSLPFDDGGFLMPLWLHLGELLRIRGLNVILDRVYFA